MTTTEEAYEKFLIEINNGSSADYVACDRDRFVRLFNKNQNRFIEGTLERRNDDEIRYVQKLLVTDEKLSLNKTKSTYQLFNLPEDYFDFSSVYGLGSTDSCKRQRISLYEIKSENENYKLQDSDWMPSFPHRESLIYITSDNIKVYRNEDFKFESLHLSYYRYPAQISLIDEFDPESKFTKTNPELDDKVTDRIITMAASDFKLNTGDPSFQAYKSNSVQKY